MMMMMMMMMMIMMYCYVSSTAFLAMAGESVSIFGEPEPTSRALEHIDILDIGYHILSLTRLLFNLLYP